MNTNEFLNQLAQVEVYWYETARSLEPGARNPYTDQLVELVLHFIEYSFASENTNAVNEALGRIDVLDRDPHILIAMLRCSFRARNLLPNWWLARTKFHTELLRQGHNADRMLRGLMHWTKEDGGKAEHPGTITYRNSPVSTGAK